MLAALDVIAPIFLVIGLGAWLRRIGLLSAEHAGLLSRFTFRVAAPLFLFHRVGRRPPEGGDHLTMVAVIVGVSVLTAAVTYALTRRAGPRRVGVLAQGAFRSNTVFFGLPVVTQAYGEEAVARAALVIGTMVITYNLLGAVVLTLPRKRVSAGSGELWRGLGRDMVTNPLVLGIVGGILLSGAGWTLPGFLDRTLDLVGRTALPLALLSIGAGLEVRDLPREWRPALAISVVKLALYPAAIGLMLHWAGLSTAELRVPVVLLASPCAVMAYVMAREMNGDEQLASAIVLGSTLLSVVSSVAWLTILG